MDAAWMAAIPDDLDIDVQKARDKHNRKLPLYPNNKVQARAIRQALGRKFTVIQGPPGQCRCVYINVLVFWYLSTCTQVDRCMCVYVYISMQYIFLTLQAPVRR